MGWDDDGLSLEYYSGAEALKETDAALLVDIDGEEVWIPKSVIGYDSDINGEGDIGTLSVQAWFARKEL